MPPFGRKVALPTEAAQAAAVGDLNRDGHPDLVFAQSAGFWEYRGGDALASPSRIFWGSADGYQRDNFLDLEAAGASDVAVADLNGDGWPEVILANRERNGKFDIGSYQPVAEPAVRLRRRASERNYGFPPTSPNTSTPLETIRREAAGGFGFR